MVGSSVLLKQSESISRDCFQHGSKRKEKLELTVGNGDKAEFLVEIRCILIFGIDKQTDETRLLGDQHCTMNSLGKQEPTVTLPFILL